jgi:SagB-type dehydrogenase family enzyme
MRQEVRNSFPETLLQTFHENTKLTPATLPFHAAERVAENVRADENGLGVIVLLPADEALLGISVRDAIVARRSVRRYRDEAMPLALLGRFLRIISSPELFADEEDAAAVAPLLDIYLFLWGAEGLSEGTYRYDRAGHALVHVAHGPLREEIGASIFQQEFSRGTGILLLTGDLAAAVEKFGQRGYRYLLMQAGLVGESAYLAGTALGIAVSGNGGTRETTAQHYCGLDGIRRDLLWTLPFGLKPGAAQ